MRSNECSEIEGKNNAAIKQEKSFPDDLAPIIKVNLINFAIDSYY